VSEVIVNCSCGEQWTYASERFFALVYNYRTRGLACDFCNEVPNINYGGMSA